MEQSLSSPNDSTYAQADISFYKPMQITFHAGWLRARFSRLAISPSRQLQNLGDYSHCSQLKKRIRYSGVSSVDLDWCFFSSIKLRGTNAKIASATRDSGGELARATLNSCVSSGEDRFQRFRYFRVRLTDFRAKRDCLRSRYVHLPTGSEIKRIQAHSFILNALYISSDSQTVSDKVRLLTFQFNSQSEITDSDNFRLHTINSLLWDLPVSPCATACAPIWRASGHLLAGSLNFRPPSLVAYSWSEIQARHIYFSLFHSCVHKGVLFIYFYFLFPVFFFPVRVPALTDWPTSLFCVLGQDTLLS